ncbi:nucleoside phosphatase family-domain-containing protein [Cercophora scortea]|uniref:Nucleoside phosphatase family-domain-containing protein n=1 Tax=Cercophora scortea TaxID=314031 RepID=A0AAE0IEG4_9PEZI|nr:nucleoside phosphatase family-domain-containing protein [Cercophora scortea]
MGGKKWRWGVILDAGSSGTRLHVYRWLDPERARHDASQDELRGLPKIVTKKKWTKKIRPGISTFGETAKEVGPEHLQALIDHALDVIPKDKVKDTPIFLMATAGMRLLPQTQQTALTSEVCSYLRQNTRFSLPDCDLHIQVIKGETEGLYGWIASNYLLGGFDHPEQHQHGKGHHTYGFLDMGGASAQIAFAPNSTEAAKHANDLKLLRLRNLNGSPAEHKVFTTTWLGFGVNQARESYVASLQELYTSKDAVELPDPCMPKLLRTTLDGTPVEKPKPGDLTLVGTGAFDECLKKTYPLLGKDKPCEDNPCLLNGQHVPAIDFDVNHFVGVSEYWHTTHGVFGDKGNHAYDFATYQRRVKDFCSQDWETIQSKVDVRKANDAKNAQEACFKASWLINVLHEGIGVPRIGIEHLPASGLNASKSAVDSAKAKGFLDPFQAVDTIDGIEVSWTLGRMVLYAAGQIPPQSGDDRYPVGFGSNDLGPTPPDFQFAGSSWRPLGHGNATADDDDWDTTAEELLDKAKARSTSGMLLILIMFLIVLYFFRKQDRRMRLYARLSKIIRKTRRPGKGSGGGRVFSGLTNKLFGRPSATYERVLEEGDLNQFELGDVDSSDDNEYSDSSEGSGSQFGRSSGLATPKVNLGGGFDALLPSAGSALGRSGLVVRTESRERLVPNMQMLGAGRRSRAGSPTRLKSPLTQEQ